MKKLMIAAAAAAMVGGAYATTGCCDDADVNTPSCNANVYSITISVKGSFQTKSVKKAGCTGLYLDNATRTVNGYMWTCCNPCEDPANGEAWQLTLWDKTAKTALLNGVSNNGGVTKTYTAEAKVAITGVGMLTVISDEKGTPVAARLDLNNKVTALGGTAPADADVTVKVIETPAKTQWVDYAIAAQDYRWGRTANNYTAWGVIPVAPANIDGSYDANKGCLDSLGAFGGLQFVMTGAWKAKEYRPTSLTGTVLGEITTAELCGDFGDVAQICDDFETWCDYALNTQYLVPVTGTIKATYVSSMKKSLYNMVPVYDRN